MSETRGRGEAPASRLPRRERRRKIAEARARGEKPKVGFAGCNWIAERGEFMLWLEDYRTGRTWRTYITARQAAGLGMAIFETLGELEGLRDMVVPGRGVPS